ncbi:hypothetical protein CBP24_20430 [Fischerella thermalis WC439]|uniref:hypothetical protein n=1 Tax=Fischerella thermalis TaxID=372787 RepID=UPI000CBC2366|nr:hypothetical protein CBP24_20430 [Fischerella thermalis WC439]
MAVLINQGDRTVTDVIKGYGFIGVHRCSFFLRLHLIAKGYILELSNTDAHRYTRMWWYGASNRCSSVFIGVRFFSTAFDRQGLYFRIIEHRCTRIHTDG